MSNPPPPPPQQTYVAPEGTYDDAPKSKGWSGCLIGCLVTFVVCAILCAGAGFYVYSNAADWIIAGVRATAEAILSDADLPQEEKDAILGELDRVTTAYKEGEVTLQELGPMMQELTESPVIGLVMLQAVDAKYLKSSGLSEEEQADAKRTLMRVMRAAMEEKLSKSEIDQLTKHVLTEVDESQPPGQQQKLKEKLSDEELRVFFAEAKQMVDEKEIPDEDFEVKASELIRQAVDKLLE